MTEKEFEDLLEQADELDRMANKALENGDADEANRLLDLRDEIEDKISNECQRIIKNT